MTRFGTWKQWIARIFVTWPPRARRRPKRNQCADLGLSLEALESRELLSADAVLSAIAHFGSAGAAGHDLIFGRGLNPTSAAASPLIATATADSATTTPRSTARIWRSPPSRLMEPRANLFYYETQRTGLSPNGSAINTAEPL